MPLELVVLGRHDKKEYLLWIADGHALVNLEDHVRLGKMKAMKYLNLCFSWFLRYNLIGQPGLAGPPVPRLSP